MQIFFLIFSVIIFLLVLGALFMTVYAGFIGAPLLPTPKSAIREALLWAKPEKGEKFFDLGTGTARSLIIAEKEFGLKSIGFELSPIIFLFAKLNLFLNGTKKAEIRLANAYEQDFKNADIIFCFLSVDPMARLKDRFEKELRPGARIISYSFRIKGWEPEKIISGYPGNIYLYRK